jgi:hypothetical protein
MQFGRRAVKLTVLSIPGVRAKATKAQTKTVTANATTADATTDKEKK